MTNKTFNLDLTKDVKTNPVVFGRIGDGGVQTITVNISNQNVPVDLTGFTITFEGVTNSQKSKIFDSQGVDSTADGLKKGTFDYVFPSAAFGVSGRYKTAYFSFIKDSTRDTTGQIDIIVSENADIDAEEAQTIITEYDKLVAELQEKTDKYISDSDTKFSDLNQKIGDLQTKIDDYTSSVQTTANDAIQAVSDALAKLQAADFYTKEEVDNKFTDKADDSAVVHNTGDENVAGKKAFTDDMTVSSIAASGGVSSKIFESKYTTASFEAQYFRVGNMVTMTTHTIVGIAQTTSYPIPEGFRPYNNGTNPLYEQQFSSGATAILRSSNATWQPRTSSGVGAGLYATTTYPTNDDFPTS